MRKRRENICTCGRNLDYPVKVLKSGGVICRCGRRSVQYKAKYRHPSFTNTEVRYRRFCMMCWELVEVKLRVYEYEEADIWELECVKCGCIVSTRVAILGGDPEAWVIE